MTDPDTLAREIVESPKFFVRGVLDNNNGREDKVRTTFDVPGTVYRVVLKTNERLAIAAAIRSRTKGAGL